jgi:hypothetical protein
VGVGLVLVEVLGGVVEVEVVVVERGRLTSLDRNN